MRTSIESRLEKLEQAMKSKGTEAEGQWLDTASMQPEDRAFAVSVEGINVKDIPTPDLERLEGLWLQYGRGDTTHEEAPAQLAQLG